MKKVIKILLWIWQFPQNFAGVIYLLFHTKDKIKTVRIIGKGEKSKNVTFYFVDNPDTSSVCLGEYIFLDKVYINQHDSIIVDCARHEAGHLYLQSRPLGPLYLPIIGIISAFWVLYDEWFHKDWTFDNRNKWYLSHFPEKQAEEFLKD